jgi:membrane protein
VSLLRRVWDVAYQTVREFLDDGGPHLAAGLAYYGVLAIAPALLIASNAAGRVLGEAAAEGQLLEVLSVLLNEEAARLFESLLIEIAQDTTTSTGAALFGVLLLLSAVAAAFNAFRRSLDMLSRVPRPEKASWRVVTRRTLLPFVLALLAVVALAIAVVMSTVVPAVDMLLHGEWAALDAMQRAWSWLLPILTATVVFTLLFRVVPDARVSWRSALIAGVATGVLFTVGMQLLALYLGMSRWTTFYGVFGAFVALLLWVYYSAQIALVGGKLAYVVARTRGEDLHHAGQ